MTSRWRTAFPRAIRRPRGDFDSTLSAILKLRMDQKKPPFQPLGFTLTVAAAMLRLVPHPPNFTPIGGVALFGGAKLRGWQAYVVPLLAMVVTDPIRSRIEGHYAAYSWATLIIYGCFLINVVLGRLFLRHSSSALKIASVAIAGSVQFYLITNFFEWLVSMPPYTHDAAGLMACYIAALPFFGRTLLGDLFYTGVLFTAYALLKRRIPAENRTLSAA